MNFLSMRVIIKRIRSIKYMMQDKSVSIWKKALIVLGIVYLLMPIDLIPIVIPVFGVFDDIILWVFILWTLRDTLDAYWVDDERVDTQRKYKNKKIIKVESVSMETESADTDKEDTDKNDDKTVREE